MIKVSVMSTEVRNQSGIAKVSGKPYSINFQTIWIHLFDKHNQPLPFPEKCEIILEKAKDEAALYYTPGDYLLSDASIYVDRTGNLSVSPRLVPLPKVKPI